MKFFRSFTVLFICLFCVCSLDINAYSQEFQMVAGAGPSTEICKSFFFNFNQLNGIQNNFSFAVMPSSIKHKGGILNSEKYLFGRTGRPLSEKEKLQNKEQIFLAKIPITFAIGLEVGVSELSIKEIEQIYTGKLKNWQEIGGADAPILLVGREKKEALFLSLKEEYPFFKNIKFDAVFTRDDDVVSFLSSFQGRHAIAFGARPNFQPINILSVKDFSSGVKVGLVYDIKNRNHPVIKKAKEYAKSSKWINQVKQTNMLALE